MKESGFFVFKNKFLTLNYHRARSRFFLTVRAVAVFNAVRVV
jgi:hypothetical protein